jgi:hypothetical protein
VGILTDRGSDKVRKLCKLGFIRRVLQPRIRIPKNQSQGTAPLLLALVDLHSIELGRLTPYEDKLGLPTTPWDFSSVVCRKWKRRSAVNAVKAFHARSSLHQRSSRKYYLSLTYYTIYTYGPTEVGHRIDEGNQADISTQKVFVATFGRTNSG